MGSNRRKRLALRGQYAGPCSDVGWSFAITVCDHHGRLFTFQWLQATSAVWVANAFGLDLSDPGLFLLYRTSRINVTPNIEETIILALCSILMISIGARLGTPGPVEFKPAVSEYQPVPLFIVYFCLLLLSRVPLSGGLAQPLLVLGSLRYAVAILLAFVWLSTRTASIPRGYLGHGAFEIDVLVALYEHLDIPEVLPVVHGYAALLAKTNCLWRLEFNTFGAGRYLGLLAALEGVPAACRTDLPEKRRPALCIAPARSRPAP